MRTIRLECPKCKKVIVHSETDGLEFISAYHLCDVMTGSMGKAKEVHPVRMQEIVPVREMALSSG